MRKFKYLIILALVLCSCAEKTEIVKDSRVKKPKEVVLNVNYKLEKEKVVIYKIFENKIYEWDFSPNFVNFIQIKDLQRDDIATNLTYTTEIEYYSFYNIFYNYGESCAIINA